MSEAPFLVRVFMNGDDVGKGMKVLVNKKAYKEFDDFLDFVTEKLGLLKPVNKLYTTDGDRIRSWNSLGNKEIDVVAVQKGKFTQADYGGEKAKNDWASKVKVHHVLFDDHRAEKENHGGRNNSGDSDKPKKRHRRRH